MSDYSEWAEKAADRIDTEIRMGFAPGVNAQERFTEIIQSAISAARREAFGRAAKWHEEKAAHEAYLSEDFIERGGHSYNVFRLRKEFHHESSVCISALAKEES